MPKTLGVHLVKSAYGQWLPGDERGHWSAAWDDKLGHVQPHTLHAGDPVRHRMAAERMKHPPVLWSPAVVDRLAHTLDRCATESTWDLAALSVEPTHFHALLTCITRDVDRTAKWLAQQMTKAVHQDTDHTGPVFAKGNWITFIFDESYWYNTIAYINRHPGAVRLNH